MLQSCDILPENVKFNVNDSSYRDICEISHFTRERDDSDSELIISRLTDGQ